jgi:hypothetical protein
MDSGNDLGNGRDGTLTSAILLENTRERHCQCHRYWKDGERKQK